MEKIKGKHTLPRHEGKKEGDLCEYNEPGWGGAGGGGGERHTS